MKESEIMTTPSQQRAVQTIRTFLEERMLDFSIEQYGERITKFETVDYPSFQSVAARIEFADLPDSSLLKNLTMKYFHFIVGKRGSIRVVSYPEAFEQFEGKRAFNMTFKKVEV